MSMVLCVLQCGGLCDETTDYIKWEERWENIKLKTQLWSEPDKFGKVHATVDWDKGPTGHCVHESCMMTLFNARKVEQAKTRQLKQIQQNTDSHSQHTSEPASSAIAAPPTKRLRSSMGPIHDRTKSVWCCKGGKGPGSQLHLISYDNAWAAFKSHTVTLDDQEMRECINCLIEFTSEQPYAVEIRYHLKCWLKYVRSYPKMSEDDKLPRLQSVTLREAQTIFFDHVTSVIFQEHELRSLQSLLRDYCSTIAQYGFPTSGIKSFYIDPRVPWQNWFPLPTSKKSEWNCLWQVVGLTLKQLGLTVNSWCIMLHRGSWKISSQLAWSNGHLGLRS